MPTIYTPSHLRVLRLHAALGCVNEMIQAFIRVSLETLLSSDWNEGKLWKDWALANNQYLQQYSYWNQQEKESYGNKFIPVFSKGDVGFFYFVSAKITSEREGLRTLKGTLEENQCLIVQDCRSCAMCWSSDAE